ncbi:MAG: zinc ribbon domain-containing protein [Candidatus Omnitrophota bacterium]|nr:MAG: zinc ribbon domain-containing protein [Candidatus Omnitrophota bacterium]RKY44350.1 MAG: zinc ribbon domain-containing protein [Candidatus Omnitrophota bacterium]HDN86549.1 zinc ribbon domain-containing protein [Candidatus Omnitrophota bacterium]
MPTYEYLCEECGYRFERFQNMSEEPVKVCPRCGQKVRRLIEGGAGFIFKGSGFYATDYKIRSSSIRTCCGRSERCDRPPCSDDGVCKR